MIALAPVCAVLALRALAVNDFEDAAWWTGAFAVLAWGAFSLRRVLLAPVPTVFDTSEFPHPLVQLNAIKILASDRNPMKEGIPSLEAFLAEVFRLVGARLSHSNTAYQVCVKLEIGSAQRTVALRYGRRVSEPELNQLLDEISELPAFPPPRGKVSIELSFRVRV